MKEKDKELNPEKTAEVDVQEKIKHEGNVLTRVLEKPIKVGEKEVKEITLDLNLITGSHICSAEAKFLSLYPHQGGAKNYSTAFHFFLIEEVTGIPSDILLSIPTIEMSPVTAFFRGFLNGLGLNSKTRIQELRKGIVAVSMVSKTGIEFFYNMQIMELENWMEAIPSER